jgi:tetratricopeptide (TPR) repeat protein
LAQSSSSPQLKRPVVIAGVAFLVLAGGVFADYWSAKPVGIEATYVGRAACIDCHKDQADAFRGSHHDLAMDVASDDSVLGDFNDATLLTDGITSRMFRDGQRFMVHTEGETGELEDFEVKYVFGVEPLQQYMVEFDRDEDLSPDEVARLQVLRISWDTVQKRWFYLRPPDVAEKLEPDDPLHWTGVAQRWQTMCAECHSTDLKRNFDPKTTRYHTTFSEIDVSCEACHGPGSLHVELANSKSLFWDRNYGYALARLKGDDPEPQLQTCAPCHSRRGVLAGGFKAGDQFCDHFSLELLRDDTYYADGQIKDEVYVYGSFVQSRMYHKGVRCTDCHDPHSLKLKHPGNETCTSCHQHTAGKYDVPSHHHHVPGTAGAMCVNCHMPERTYMDVDPRRDHSLRVPRPDLSVKLGTPNACSGCHVADQLESIDGPARPSLKEYSDLLAAADEGDQQVDAAIKLTDKWCDDACEQWYGSNRKKPAHFAEPIVAMRSAGSDPDAQKQAIEDLLRLAVTPDEFAPAIARASALAELATAGVTAATKTAKQILDNPNEHPVVRAAAINLFMGGPNQISPAMIRKALLPYIDDESRLVRTEAARVLVTSGAYQTLRRSEKSRVDLALREVRDAMMMASDRAGAHMGWAMLREGQGRYAEAIEAYETAMRVEPGTTGPRTNLASLLEGLAGESQGLQAAQLMSRVAQLRAAELPLLGRDASLAPDNAQVQYRYGLALYLAGRMTEAMERLNRATELAPDVPDFRQARDLLQEKLQQQ